MYYWIYPYELPVSSLKIVHKACGLLRYFQRLNWKLIRINPIIHSEPCVNYCFPYFLMIHYTHHLSYICVAELERLMNGKLMCAGFIELAFYGFLVSIWDRRKQLLYSDGSACMTQQNNPTPPECMVNSTECYDC